MGIFKDKKYAIANSNLIIVTFTPDINIIKNKVFLIGFFDLELIINNSTADKKKIHFGKHTLRGLIKSSSHDENLFVDASFDVNLFDVKYELRINDQKYELIDC